jgi:hypothetical protein
MRSDAYRMRAGRLVGVEVCATLCVTLLWACAGEAPPATVLRHDSAGVAIIEPQAPAWGAASPWTIDSVPRFDLLHSGTGPPYELSGVTDATLLPDGRVVVLDDASHQVRFFGGDGTFLNATGREGDGPGDFKRAQDVFPLPGDSVGVFDYWLRRVTILDGQGRVGRVVTLPKDLQSFHLYPLRGGFMALTWSLDDFVANAPGDYLTRFTVERLSREGAVVDTLAVIPGWNGHKEGVGQRYTDYAPLFPVQGVAAVWEDTVVMGGGGSMTFSRYSLQGGLAQIVRAPVLDEPVTDEEVAAERASLIGPHTSAETRRIFESLPAPAMRPAYHDLQLDPEGYVWAARYHSPRRQRDDPTTWHVFDRDGAWLGDLVTPARFQVFEIGADYILGVQRDSLDVEDVQVLGLRRGGG